MQLHLGVTESLSNTDQITLQKNVGNLEISTPYTGYSKVIITVGKDEDGEEIAYIAGDDTGRTLSIVNPFGTQEQANDILEKIRGWQYQPYQAQNALLDPAAEIGDGVTINKIYSGIYSRNTNFTSLLPSEISAPQSEEIEHEVAVLSPTLRTFSRQIKATMASLSVTADEIAAEVAARTEAEEEIRASLSVQADEISAKVSKVGGESSSFGWTLTDSAWSLKSGSREVLKADSSGIKVNGIVQATSGFIGSSETNGFNITSRAIYNNLSEFGGSQSSGVYIGTNGIQLGQGFKVSSSGSLEASRGTFGSLSVDSGGRTGGSYHGGLSGCGGSVSTGLSVGSKKITTFVTDLIANTVTANYIKSAMATITGLSVKSLIVTSSLSASGITFKQHTLSNGYITDGNGVQQKVVKWS